MMAALLLVRMAVNDDDFTFQYNVKFNRIRYAFLFILRSKLIRRMDVDQAAVLFLK